MRARTLVGRVAGAAALVLASAQLAGCAGVPAEGPVTPAGPLAARPPLLVNAPSPVPGEGPEGIVRGFLQAGGDFSKDHQVAREYLLPDAEWHPESTVVVVEDDSVAVRPLTRDGAVIPSATAAAAARPAPSSSPSAGGPERRGGGGPEDGSTVRVRVEAKVVARVDQGGVYAPATGSAARMSMTLTLVAQQGQWRIRTPPAGLTLTTALFSNYFRATPLYFPDRTGEWLVPDVRWFPLLADPSATIALAVNALLHGPVPWLGDAVTTGAPPGTTTTALAPVRIEGRTVRVDLSRSARDATPAQRVLLRAQLLATVQALAVLRPDGGVDDVVITQDQARYDVPARLGPIVPGDASASTSASDQLQRDGDSGQAPLCVVADHVGQLLAQGTQCIPHPKLDKLTAPGIRLPASDVSGSVYAVVAAGGTQVLAAGVGKPFGVVVRGRALTAPSIDAAGWVWSLPRSPGASFQVGGLNRAPATVSAPRLAGAQVLSLRVSAEGARALIVLRRGSHTQVLLTGIVRDRDGRPRALESLRDPLDLLPDATSVVDADWRDAQDVIVLAARPSVAGSATYAWRVAIGGGVKLEVLQPVPLGALGVAAGANDLFVRVAGGKAYRRDLGSWDQISVQDPALPG
jgi:hypothetical protein